MDIAASALAHKVWEAAESGDLIAICAWCGSARIDGVWEELPRGILETIDQPMILSHSICPACARPA